MAERDGGNKRAKSAKRANKDRRRSARYTVFLDVRYQLHHWSGPKVAGTGRTVDFSSSGLRLLAENPLPPGTSVELCVDWPIMLEGGVPLQLVGRATVVWSIGLEAGLRLHRSKFKTRARKDAPGVGE